MKFRIAQQGGSTTDHEFEEILGNGAPSSAEPAKPADLGRATKRLVSGEVGYELDVASAPELRGAPLDEEDRR